MSLNTVNFSVQQPLPAHICGQEIQPIQNQTLIELNQWVPRVSAQIEQSLLCPRCTVRVQEGLRGIVENSLKHPNFMLPVINSRHAQLQVIPSTKRNTFLKEEKIVKNSSSPFYQCTPVMKPLYGQSISMDDAEILFKGLASSPFESWEFNTDGCARRAYIAAAILMSRGVPEEALSYVLYIAPNIGLFTAEPPRVWAYHTAVAVATTEGRRIFDPALHDHPLTAQTWIRLQTNPTISSTASKSIRIFDLKSLGDDQVFSYENFESAFIYMPVSHYVYQPDIDQKRFSVAVLHDEVVLETLKTLTLHKTMLIFRNLPQTMKMVLQEEVELLEMKVDARKRLDSRERIATIACYRRLEASVEHKLPLLLAADLHKISPTVVLQSDYHAAAAIKLLQKYEQMIDGFEKRGELSSIAGWKVHIMNQRMTLLSEFGRNEDTEVFELEEDGHFLKEIEAEKARLASLPCRLALEEDYLARLTAVGLDLTGGDEDMPESPQ